MPGAGSRSPDTWTLTLRGRVCVAAPVIAFRVPEAGGAAAIMLSTQVLVAVEPVFGIGSGGPNLQAGDEQFRLLPVSTEVVAARTIAEGTLQSATLKVFTEPSGVGDGGCAAEPPPMYSVPQSSCAAPPPNGIRFVPVPAGSSLIRPQFPPGRPVTNCSVGHGGTPSSSSNTSS